MRGQEKGGDSGGVSDLTYWERSRFIRAKTSVIVTNYCVAGIQTCVERLRGWEKCCSDTIQTIILDFLFHFIFNPTPVHFKYLPEQSEIFNLVSKPDLKPTA